MQRGLVQLPGERGAPPAAGGGGPRVTQESGGQHGALDEPGHQPSRHEQRGRL